jgi:hypothetical protein
LNKIVSTKKTSAIFLAIVLVAGTIAAFSQSFMVGAQAQPYYEMDNNYNDNYGKDSYKSKDSNKIVKKINCNNVNVNANGLELDGLPPFLTGLTSEAQTADEGQTGASSYGSGEGSYDSSEQQSGSDKDFKFVCINNNNNTVVEVDDGVTPPTPEEECILCFTNVLFLTGPVEITDDFIMQFESIFDTDIDLVAGEELTFSELCGLFEEFSERMTDDRIVDLLEALNIVIPLDIEPFINCLIDAGIIGIF